VKPWYDTKSGVSTWVTVTISTGHVKQGGVQGWLQLGAVQGLASWIDAADITMRLTFDYGRASQSNHYNRSVLFAANTLDAQWLMQVQNGNSIAEAMQVTLNDSPANDGTSSSGQSVRWLGVAVDLTPIGMRNLNLPASVKA
jgi:hypothetical protein